MGLKNIQLEVAKENTEPKVSWKIIWEVRMVKFLGSVGYGPHPKQKDSYDMKPHVFCFGFLRLPIHRIGSSASECISSSDPPPNMCNLPV